jgi:hypothetical protein
MSEASTNKTKIPTNTSLLCFQRYPILISITILKKKKKKRHHRSWTIKMRLSAISVTATIASLTAPVVSLGCYGSGPGFGAIESNTNKQQSIIDDACKELAGLYANALNVGKEVSVGTNPRQF